jgi:hypothetical protein
VVYRTFANLKQSRGCGLTFGCMHQRRSTPSQVSPAFSMIRAEAGFSTSQTSPMRQISGWASARTVTSVNASVIRLRPQHERASTYPKPRQWRRGLVDEKAKTPRRQDAPRAWFQRHRWPWHRPVSFRPGAPAHPRARILGGSWRLGVSSLPVISAGGDCRVGPVIFSPGADFWMQKRRAKPEREHPVLL